MLQISNKIYCDDIFENIYIENKILSNPYYEYPYLVIKDFFSDELSTNIVSSIKNSFDYKKAQIITNNSNINNSIVKEEFRKTNIYKLNDKFTNLYNRKFKEIVPLIEKYFNLILTTSTNIQVLEYTKGSFYIKHADDSSEIIDKKGKTISFKNINLERKISTVLFTTKYADNISDDYSFNGGELVFNYLYDENQNQIKFKPDIGDLIVFPSNPIFSHEILKVKNGYRLTLVQWHDAII